MDSSPTAEPSCWNGRVPPSTPGPGPEANPWRAPNDQRKVGDHERLSRRFRRRVARAAHPAAAAARVRSDAAAGRRDVTAAGEARTAAVPQGERPGAGAGAVDAGRGTAHTRLPAQ